MLLLTELEGYVSQLGEYLTKIETTMDRSEQGGLYVTKTKEVFTYDDEQDADDKINEARQNLGFAGVDKKYKAGKMNKAGEVVKPECWVVTIKLNH